MAKKLVSRRIQVEGNRFFDGCLDGALNSYLSVLSFSSHYPLLDNYRVSILAIRSQRFKRRVGWAGKFRIGRYLGEITQ